MSWLKKSLLFLLVLAAAAVAWAVIFATSDEVGHLSQNIDLSEQTRFIRWTILTTIIVFWSELIEFFGRKKLLPEQVDIAKNMHLRVAVALITFELLVVESVTQYLV